ncbi:type II CAAX prenyl endopeptidase Rce1 family protein, partial [Escherichia coli]|uniref:CPBP family glutamic-type intramembrane protease n=1 Tax=Escherichia coli TaxID=562 RepID=UPI00202CCD76
CFTGLQMAFTEIRNTVIPRMTAQTIIDGKDVLYPNAPTFDPSGKLIWARLSNIPGQAGVNEIGAGPIVYRTGIMIIQLFVPYLLAVRKTEEWMISQMSFSGVILWINIFSSVLLVPVYEEIVFRGCLFNSFKFWFNDNIYTSAIVTSVIFSALHLQYTDFHTFLMLFLVSLVLISAKIKSNGLLMPILLHMSMNAVIAGIQYLASISYTH